MTASEPVAYEIAADGETVRIRLWTSRGSMTAVVPQGAWGADMAREGLVIRRTVRRWLVDIAHGRWSG